MIESGEKKEEYRKMSDYWEKRLLPGNYKLIKFRNGYHSNAPTILVEYKGLFTGIGNPEWGAPEEPVFIIKLGEVVPF